MAQAQIQTRLCPHCANSITFDAMKCPYCRADLLPSTEPEWPHNDEYVERSLLQAKPLPGQLLGAGRLDLVTALSYQPKD